MPLTWGPQNAYNQLYSNLGKACLASLVMVKGNPIAPLRATGYKSITHSKYQVLTATWPNSTEAVL